MQCAVCHKVQRGSSVKFDRAEMAFILALFHWLKPLTDEGREETEYLENPPPFPTGFRKCHILKPNSYSPNRDSKPHSGIGGQALASKADTLNHYTMCCPTQDDKQPKKQTQKLQNKNRPLSSNLKVCKEQHNQLTPKLRRNCLHTMSKQLRYLTQ